jgi:hypothetical protein
MRNVIYLIGFAFLLVGCNKMQGMDGTSATISGVVSAGPVNNANVVAHSINQDGTAGTQLGSAITDNSGKFSLNLSSNSGPILIIASGGSYQEEASGQTVTLGNAQIRTVLSTVENGQEVGVTPITEIAAQSALSLIAVNDSVDPETIINNSNAAVSVAMGIPDITIPPANPTLAANQAKNTAQAQYALVLASISQLANDAGTANGTILNSLDLMQALATAFTYNGSFEGTVTGIEISVGNGSGVPLNLSNILGGSTNFDLAMAGAMSTVASVLPLGFDDDQQVPPLTFNMSPQMSGDLPIIDFPVPPGAFAPIRPIDDGAPELPDPVPRYTIGGTISGLNAGAVISLQNNDQDDLLVMSAGSFTFSHAVLSGARYNISVLKPPLGQVCTIDNSTDLVAGTNVTNVEIACISSRVVFNGKPGSGYDGYTQGISIGHDAEGNLYVMGRGPPGLNGLPTTGFEDFEGLTMFITKYNADLVRQWTVESGKCISPTKIAVDAAGSVYATGLACDDLDGEIFEPSHESDYFVTKYDTDGNRLWTALDGAPELASNWGTYGLGIAVNSTGDVYVTGLTSTDLGGHDHKGSHDAFLAKYNSQGVRQWTVLDGAPSNGTYQPFTWGQYIAFDSQGYVYLFGRTTSPLGEHEKHGMQDYYLSKFDSSGAKLWTYQDGYPLATLDPAGLEINANDEIFVVANTNISLLSLPKIPNQQIYMVSKFTSDGEQVWLREDEVDTGNLVVSVDSDSEGNLYLTGRGYESEVFIKKLSPEAEVMWTLHEGLRLGSNIYSYDITVNSSGRSYTTGNTPTAFGGQTMIGGVDMFIIEF